MRFVSTAVLDRVHMMLGTLGLGSSRGGTGESSAQRTMISNNARLF